VGGAMGGRDGAPPAVFRSSKYNDTLVDWLQAGASSKERERTMSVLHSTLKFKPQTRPRTSGSGSGSGTGRPGSSAGRQYHSARARPNSTGTNNIANGLLKMGDGGSEEPIKPHKAKPSRALPPRPVSRGTVPPKPASPTSVLQADTALEASSGRPRSRGGWPEEVPSFPTVMVSGQVYSARPETPKVQSVEQRFALRPSTPQRSPGAGGGGGVGRPPVGPFKADSPAAVGSGLKAVKAARSAPPDRSLDLTSNSITYGIREAAPEVYEDMLDVSRASQAENANFVSQCDFSDGFPMFMRKTAYEEANERAAATVQDNSAAQARSFHNWINRQRYYFGDLLTPEASAQIDTWFDTATDEEKDEFLVAFRNIHAAADPDRHKSLSHVQFKAMKNVLDENDLALINEENRRATYGRPKMRDVSVKVGMEQQQRPGTAPMGSSTSGRPSKPLAREDFDLKTELYTSNVPLKWACTNLGPLKSAYQLSHGANSRDMMKSIHDTMDQRANMMRPLGLGPTLGFGKVDPVIYQHKTAAFPVPDCMVHGTLANAEKRDDNKFTTYMTMHGQSVDKPWALLDPSEKLTARKVAAIEAMRLQEFQERLKRTSVPLGSTAIFNQIDPKTMYQTQLTRYDEKAYRADPSAARLVSVYTGPTASVAACAPAEGIFIPSRASLTKGRRGSAN